jgi:hypothetical protein
MEQRIAVTAPTYFVTRETTGSAGPYRETAMPFRNATRRGSTLAATISSFGRVLADS